MTAKTMELGARKVNGLKFSRYGLCSCVAAALLASCGGSQSPIGAPGAMPLSYTHTQKRSDRNAGLGKGKEYVYVANRYSNDVSAYAINASTGALTQVQGSPFAAGTGAYAVAIDPTGRFAYVANDGNGSGNQGNVSGFAINPRSGALTPLQGSPFAAGSNPIAIAIAADGKFAYVANYFSANVSMFAINASTGALRQVKGSPLKTRPFPTTVAMDPTGQFAYLTHWGLKPIYHPGHIDGYAINAHSGALRQLRHSVLLTGYEPIAAQVDPSGRFVYVANWSSTTVSAYTIAAGTGALSEVQGSPFYAGDQPGAVTIDPGGKFAYVACDLGVAGYKIASNGVLTPIPGSPFAGGYEPDGAAIDPLGKFAFVATDTGSRGNVVAYSIDPSDGALTQVPGSPFGAGTRPTGLATCEVERGRCVPAPR